MYETEINKRAESPGLLPPGIRAQFIDGREHVTRRTLLTWGEHCTECVIPTCYTTCDLYDARPDGKCARFVEGMVRVNLPHKVHRYLLKIRFRQWGKLWTDGNIRLYSLRAARAIEGADRLVSRLIQALPLPGGLKMRLVKRWYGLKKRWVRRPATHGASPSYFLLESYNPGQTPVSMTLTIRPTGARSMLPFQEQIDASPGFTRAKIPVSKIVRNVNLSEPFGIDITLNDAPPDTALYFGLMDFVQDDACHQPQAKLCKCVVWDLDNTLWEGTLIEDGPEALQLKPGVTAVIHELDRRGILQSIVSKNNPEDAMAVLRRFELDDYFLYPQMSWEPKGRAVGEIARLLNIGLDTVLVIDDQPFEREQIQAACPATSVIDATEYLGLTDRPECQVPVTNDSANRRRMYWQQTHRVEAQSAFDGDYFTFLLDCQMKLRLKRLGDENLQRVHELTQRTNQMNFSGNRYDRDRLAEIMKTVYLHTYVMDCEDKFGHYGTVGLCVVDSREPRMIDLMFSCRIQSKRVEHAFLAHILGEYITRTNGDFHANYRRTPRNAPSGKVFEDLGFEQVAEADGVASLVFRHTRTIPNDDIVEVIVQQSQRA